MFMDIDQVLQDDGAVLVFVVFRVYSFQHLCGRDEVSSPPVYAWPQIHTLPRSPLSPIPTNASVLKL